MDFHLFFWVLAILSQALRYISSTIVWHSPHHEVIRYCCIAEGSSSARGSGQKSTAPPFSTAGVEREGGYAYGDERDRALARFIAEQSEIEPRVETPARKARNGALRKKAARPENKAASPAKAAA